MFQDPYASLDPRMRVRSIIREPLRIQDIGTHAEQDKRVSDVLAEVGLQPKAADLYPHEFSGGQRQRIGLARALVLQPKLIVADEPVSALDVSIRAQILNLMRSLQERHDLTYIVISHDLAVVKYLADTIGVMYLGKLVEIGPSDELYYPRRPSLHPGADRHHPGPRPVSGQAAGGGGKRRAPVGHFTAQRLPVPHPLPVRTGPLRRGRATAAAICRGPPGGVPFPAPDPVERGPVER